MNLKLASTQLIQSNRRMTRLDLLNAVEAAIETLYSKIRERNVAVFVRYPNPPVHAWVRGDHEKLQQVFIHLLDNAIKYSPIGGNVRIALCARGQHWYLRIVDKGSGIPPEILPTLLEERFSQADGSHSRVHRGIGVNMAAVRKIVEAHGGRVWIESNIGAGTAINVELPAAVVSPEKKEVSSVAHSSY